MAYARSRFEVAQGLRQGCVLSPLLFNLLFVAILLVALLIERFSEHAGILQDLADLQEQPAKVGPDTALERALRAIFRDAVC